MKLEYEIDEIIYVITDKYNNRYNEEMKLEQLHKVGSESELNTWPDSSVGQSV